MINIYKELLCVNKIEIKRHAANLREFFTTYRDIFQRVEKDCAHVSQ